MAIDIQSVSFAYPDGTTPIEDVSFKVPTGSVTALVGPNGVGKTTMLEIVAGVLRTDEGTVRTDTEISYMRQNPGFDDLSGTSVLDALALSLPRSLHAVHDELQRLYAHEGEGSGRDLDHQLDIWQSLGG